MRFFKRMLCLLLAVLLWLGVFLGAAGLYAPLADLAGYGAAVPLTGFGYLISRGVRSAVHARGLLGALIGPLSASAAGIAAALTFSLIAALIFRGKPKN